MPKSEFWSNLNVGQYQHFAPKSKVLMENVSEKIKYWSKIEIQIKILVSIDSFGQKSKLWLSKFWLTIWQNRDKIFSTLSKATANRTGTTGWDWPIINKLSSASWTRFWIGPRTGWARYFTSHIITIKQVLYTFYLGWPG